MAYDGIPARQREAKTQADPCGVCGRRVKLFRDGECRRCWFLSRQQAMPLTDSAEDAEEVARIADFRHHLAKERRNS